MYILSKYERKVLPEKNGNFNNQNEKKFGKIFFNSFLTNYPIKQNISFSILVLNCSINAISVPGLLRKVSFNEIITVPEAWDFAKRLSNETIFVEAN